MLHGSFSSWWNLKRVGKGRPYGLLKHCTQVPQHKPCVPTMFAISAPPLWLGVPAQFIQPCRFKNGTTSGIPNSLSLLESEFQKLFFRATTPKDAPPNSPRPVNARLARAAALASEKAFHASRRFIGRFSTWHFGNVKGPR